MSDIKIIIGADITELQAAASKAGVTLKQMAVNTQVPFSALTSTVNKSTEATKGAVVINKQLALESGKSGSSIKSLANNLTSVIGPANLMAAGIGVGAAALIGLGAAWVKIVAKDFVGGIDKVALAHQKAAEATREYKKELESIIGAVAKEATEVVSLVAILRSETETRERKLGAIKELNKIAPEIFGNLKLEGNAVVGLNEAYKAYIANLSLVISAKLLQVEIEKKITKILELQGLYQTESQKKALASFTEFAKKRNELISTGAPGPRKLTAFEQTTIDVRVLNAEIEELTKKLLDLSKGIKVKPVEIKPEKVTIKPEKVELDLLDRKLSVTTISEIPKLALPQLKIVAGDRPFIFDPKIADNVFAGLAKLLKDAANEKRIAELADEITSVIQNTMVDAFSGIGEVIAAAVSSGDISKAFDGIVNTIGAGVKAIGRALIKYGVQALIIKNLGKINPYVAIAAGIALVALGSVLQNSVNKVKGFATGVRNFTGGVAMVGERGPELITLPRGSDVIPNNQVNASGGGGLTLMPSIEYSGSGFRIMLNRVDAQNRRNN